MARLNFSERDLSAGQYVYALCLNRGALIKASTMPSFPQRGIGRHRTPPAARARRVRVIVEYAVMSSRASA
jgi:hypothetical protein